MIRRNRYYDAVSTFPLQRGIISALLVWYENCTFRLLCSIFVLLSPSLGELRSSFRVNIAHVKIQEISLGHTENFMLAIFLFLAVNFLVIEESRSEEIYAKK